MGVRSWSSFVLCYAASDVGEARRQVAERKEGRVSVTGAPKRLGSHAATRHSD